MIRYINKVVYTKTACESLIFYNIICRLKKAFSIIF